jgi:CRP-like cAMP-binding protein
MLIQQGNVCNRVFVVTRGEIAIYRVISMPKSWRQTHSRTFMALRTIDQASSLIVTPLRLLAGSMLRNEFTPSAAVPVMVEAPLEDDSDSDADDEEHFVSSPFEPSLDHSDAECESVLVQVDTLLPGDVLGFLPSAEGGREISSFYAVARTECDVFCVSADHVLEFVDVATRMRLSNHFAEQRVDERSVMLHVLQQKAWQEFSQASVQAAHVEVAPESIRTGVNANTFNLQPPVHVAAPDEDAIRFDFSVCQGVLPSQNQIQSIEQLYQSFDPRTAAKLAVEHATQKMSHESVRAVLSPTASQVAAERGFRSTANQLPARKEVLASWFTVCFFSGCSSCACRCRLFSVQTH